MADVRNSFECPDHPGESLRMYCKECNILVCYDCIIGPHDLHKKAKLEDIIQSKKCELADSVTVCVELLSSFEDYNNELRKHLSTYLEDVEKVKSEIKTKNENLKQELDQIATSLLDQVKEKATEDIKTINETFKHSEKIIQQMREFITATEEKMKDQHSNIDVIQYGAAAKDKLEGFKNVKFKNPQSLTSPTLRIHDEEATNIQKLIGSLEYEDDDQKGSDVLYPDIDATDEENDQDKMKESLENFSKSSTLRLSGCQQTLNTSIITTFKLENNMSDVIASVNSKRAWVCSSMDFSDKDTSSLTLVSDKGAAVKVIKPGFEIFDITVMPNEQLLVTDGDGHHVKKMKMNAFTRIYKFVDIADYFPFSTLGICVSKEGFILVGLSSETSNCHKVLRIYPNGDVYDTIQYDTDGETPLFSSPNRIRQSVLMDICVLQDNSLVVIGDDGTHKFTYVGSGNDDCTFEPFGVETDKSGNILVSDTNDSCIHVIDRNGLLFQFLLTEKDGIDKPLGITIDEKDRLWICFLDEDNDKRVTIIKYL